MIVFWSVAAIMVAACLAWLLPVLFNTRIADADPGPTHTDHAIASYEERVAAVEQELADGAITAAECEEARSELARELLQDARPDREPVRAAGPAAGWLLLVALPAACVALYSALGAPEGLDDVGPGVRQAQAATSAAPGPSAPAAEGAMPSIEEMVGGLAARLESNPEDGEGWLMLGRSYAVLNRTADAEQAYARAYALVPDNVDVLTGYAEALARNNGNSLQGQPETLLQTALTLVPGDPKTLWLAGIAAMQRGDRDVAVRHWSALKATGALALEETASLERMIADAGGPPPSAAPAASAATAASSAPASSAPASSAPASATPATAPAARATASSAAVASGVSVRVKVRIDDALAARVGPSDVLFVFARAQSGPPMPLAVVRRRATDLPVEVTLDESMAMMPQMTLATVPRVVVGARISRTGNARSAPGDLQGLSNALSPADTDVVEVVISSVVGG